MPVTAVGFSVEEQEAPALFASISFVCSLLSASVYPRTSPSPLPSHRPSGLEEAAGVESGPVEELGTTAEPGILTNGREAAAVGVQNPPATENLPVDGAEWVDLFVREMVSATNVNDAKVRASKLLEVLEKAINNHEAEEASKTFLKENVMLKEQVEILTQENRVLKRSVAIQHERQKEYQDKNYELQQLRQLVSQYQEQLQTLQMNNFTLTMHFRQTQ
ncbi:putative Ubiquitin system component Cue protein [Hibiscus syriacus]|uniref:Ubiquitin system component Cue protein n=1 Tax=Hibiscus syriacus TaxID=106335 RepID=A0A6A3D367_HIBSY|nr:putative Ubiquitin system component Cue protein [Hibiscus syriacus]